MVDILLYLPYFEDLIPSDAYKYIEPTKHKDGSMSLPGYNYDDKFLQFTHDFYNSGLSVSDYSEILNTKVPDWQTVNINEVLETSDLELTKAILTKSIRVERFCDGAWAGAIENGTFLAILKRLSVLLS